MFTSDDSFWWRQQAVCALPQNLPLVDAVFDDTTGKAAKKMRSLLCDNCPVVAQCLGEAMVNPTHGMWGGATQRQRRYRGAPRVVPHLVLGEYDATA